MFFFSSPARKVSRSSSILALNTLSAASRAKAAANTGRPGLMTDGRPSGEEEIAMSSAWASSWRGVSSCPKIGSSKIAL